MSTCLKTNGLAIGFAGKIIVDDIDLAIKCGAITSIIGRNGSGKSTLVKTIAGLIPRLAGQISFYGDDIKTIKRKELAKSLAYLAQRHLSPDDITVEELVYYGRFPQKKWYANKDENDHLIVDKCLALTDMTGFKKRRLNSLSGGESQRAWIAMSLAQEPKLLILDEPTTYMDIYHQIEVLELLKSINRADGITIVMVLHDINQAIQYSDDLIVLNNGKKHAQGHPSEIVNCSLIQEVFNLQTRCIDLPHHSKHYIPIMKGNVKHENVN